MSMKLIQLLKIGVNYGGLCRLISPKLQLGGKIKFVDGLHLYIEIHSDLVISNYAFSELKREVQDMYLEKVILNSNAAS